MLEDGARQAVADLLGAHCGLEPRLLVTAVFERLLCQALVVGALGYVELGGASGEQENDREPAHHSGHPGWWGWSHSAEIGGVTGFVAGADDDAGGGLALVGGGVRADSGG